MSARSKETAQSSRKERRSNTHTTTTNRVVSGERGAGSERSSSMQTNSTIGMSSGRSASLQGVGSSTASVCERGGEDTNDSAPSNIWELRDNSNQPTTGDKTTVAGVVADNLFQRAKFVDRDTDLMYDERDGSVCKFVTTLCNLQADINRSDWWKQARKWIPVNISRLRNDKNTAMKWAFLGTYLRFCI